MKVVCTDGTKLRETRTVSGTATVFDWCGDIVLETDDYYPLGGALPTGTSTTLQPEKYQGKEWNSTSGFNVYDFGARLYDPSIGRWLSQDPMAEKYYPHSPYLFCAGNPMKFVDPEGSSWYFNIENGVFVSHIDDKDDKIYMLTESQIEQFHEKSNILRKFRSDNNTFGQLMLEETLSDQSIYGVYSYMYGQANSTNSDGNDSYLLSIPQISIVSQTKEEMKSKGTLPTVSTGSITGNLKVCRTTSGHYYNGYDIINLLSHELKHRMDVIEKIYPSETSADVFSINHWSYKKTSEKRKNDIIQHLLENKGK